MSVRAKMRCTVFTPGRVGSELHLSAVYEGSNDLQKISENAIFGDATPSGNFTLYGAVPYFAEREEYYLDLYAPGEIVQLRDPLVSANLRKVWRSEPDPNFPTAHIGFRFTITDPEFSGSLDMSIANPAAVALLDDDTVWVLLIRLARGRRSDAEIAMIEGLLAEHIEVLGRAWDRAGEARASGDPVARQRFYDENLFTLDRDAYIERGVGDLRRKLALAKDEA